MKNRTPTELAANGALRYGVYDKDGSLLRYEYLKLEDNPTDQGTILAKETLLEDATAALFGLGADSVPDDVLAFLGKYNQHWWKRRINKVTAQLGEVENATLSASTSARDTDSVTYSDGITIDTATGRGSLSEPTTTITCSYDKYTNANVLAGKYFINYQGELYYAEPTARAVNSRESSYYYSEIPAAVVTATQELGEWEELVSSDRSAYPDSGESDGYEWQYIGVPFDNAVSAPKIQTGSYIGTGTYGKENPNTLSFNFLVKLLLITGSWGDDYTQRYTAILNVEAGTYSGLDHIGNHAFSGTIVRNDDEVSWYNNYNVAGQGNVANSDYTYIAIG